MTEQYRFSDGYLHWKFGDPANAARVRRLLGLDHSQEAIEPAFLIISTQTIAAIQREWQRLMKMHEFVIDCEASEDGVYIVGKWVPRKQEDDD